MSIHFSTIPLALALAACAPESPYYDSGAIGFGEAKDGAYQYGANQNLGKVFVASDEWTLSYGGMQGAGGVALLQGVASWFTGGATGKFLIYDDGYQDPFGSAGFVSALTTKGHTVVETETMPTLSQLLQYDGIFVSGRTSPWLEYYLIYFVESGGGVYVAGGTGKINEPAAYNDFLGYFGLGYGAGYDPDASAYRDINFSHPLGIGTQRVLDWGGSPIVDLDPNDPGNFIIASPDGYGLYAAFDLSYAFAGGCLDGASPYGYYYQCRLGGF
jgi:hypothetical protein